MSETGLWLARPGQAPLAAAAAVSLVAALAWIGVIGQSLAMAGSMSLGQLDHFQVQWVVMMAAMMLPSTVPFVRRSVARQALGAPWPATAGLVVATYLIAWAAFSAVAYIAYQQLRMLWAGQSVVAGVMIILAGLYTITPLSRWLRSQCQLIDTAPAGSAQAKAGLVLRRSLEYAGACIGSSAILMLALIALGMSNLLACVAMSAYVFIGRVWRPSRASEYAVASGAVFVGLLLVVYAR